ncbi:MAG TPA: hypothetical protein PKM88_12235, partial [bacterium]|nr:hypothetical protein [bacterium]
ASVSSLVVQNLLVGNTDTALHIYSTAAADTFEKNNIISATGKCVTNNASAGWVFDLRRTWWGTTDSTAIGAVIAGSAAGLVNWQPFRLGACDTVTGADTIAPAAPATVGCTAGVSYVRVAWTASTTNEEIGGAVTDLAGYRVYRAQRADTSSWRYIGQTAGLSLNDSTAAADTVWCYAVTAYDNHAGWPNESYFSAASNYDTPVSTLALAVLAISDSTHSGTQTASPQLVNYDSIWVSVRGNVGDTIIISNSGTGGDTRTWTGRDTQAQLGMAPGTNVITVTVISGGATSCSTFVVFVDTSAPSVTAFTLGGRVHYDPVSGRYSTDSASLLLLSSVTDSSPFLMRVGEDSAFVTGSDTGWRAYSAALTCTYAATGGTVTLYVRYGDSCGNATLRTAVVVIDTAGPTIGHTPVADSQACNETLSVSALLNDASGTMAVTAAWVWFSNPNQYAGKVGGWDSAAMSRQGATASWAGNIPAAAIGQFRDDSIAYFITATDTFGRIGAYASQLNPDSFTTDSGLSAVISINLSPTDTRTPGSGGTYATPPCTIVVSPAPQTDTVTIAYYRDGVPVDTFTSGTGGDTAQPLPNMTTGTYVIVIWLQDTGGMPGFWRNYTVYVDTYAPLLFANVLTAGDIVSFDNGLTASPDTSVAVFCNVSDTDNGIHVPGGAALMQLAEDSAFAGATATGWLAYAADTTWNFANADGDSVLQLYLRFKDNAGNTSPLVARSIAWDTQPPSIVFAGIGDSMAAGRPLTVTASCTDLAGVRSVAIITASSPFSSWDTWPLAAAGGTLYTGNIPASAIGDSPSLTGLRYYLMATDSWGRTIYWVGGDAAPNDHRCTDITYARTLWCDSFTVAAPVALTAAARDIDTGYVTLVSYGSAWQPVWYRGDSFSVSVRTNADSLAVYVYDAARSLVWRADTFSLAQGATNQDTVLYLGSHLADGLNFLQLIGFDHTEPVNFDTFAVYADTGAPLFTGGPAIAAGRSAVKDTATTISFAGADSYAVTRYFISTVHPATLTD